MESFLTITEVKYSIRQRELGLKCYFFKVKEKYIIKIDCDKISFTRPSLDYIGKTYTASSNNIVGGVKFRITADNLEAKKKIEINSDDITEDELTVYYNE